MSVSDFIKALSENQVQYICDELFVSKDSFDNITREQLSELYDKLCDIEIEEAIKADNDGKDISSRGEMAANIVTVWGNMLWQDDQDDDN